MTTAPTTALLALFRLASPALPVGGFSYSEGLESAIDAGRASGEDGVRAWLVDQLHLGLARSDLPVVVLATRAWSQGDGAALAALNTWVRATRETAELALQTEQMGRSMAQWLRGAGDGDPRVQALDALAPAPTWPLAFSLAGARSGGSVDDVAVAFAAGWAESLAHAAVRAMPLGQSAGQRLIAALHAQIPDALARARRTPRDALQSFMPMLAIASSQHETQYSRLFRS